MSLEQIWSQMEHDDGEFASGQLQRRIIPESPFDLVVAVEKPGNRRVLLFSVSDRAARSIDQLQSSRGVGASVAGENDKQHSVLRLRLEDNRFSSMFSSLCDNIVNSVEQATDELMAVRMFADRLARWQQFLERVGSDILSDEAQTGLFAELWFLRYLLENRQVSSPVLAWSGPDGAAQDFQINGLAVEVKATGQTSPQVIRVSNERQLDESGTTMLVMLHSSWDVRHGSTHTLPDIIENIRLLVADSPEQRESFDLKLIGAGYADDQQEHYVQTAYTLLKESVFLVREGFPRLKSELLPPGVTDVKYSVSLSACRPFEVAKSYLTNALMEA